MSQEEPIPSFVIAAGFTTLALGSAVAFLLLKKKGKEERNYEENVSEEDELDSTKYPGGYLTIYYGSQTGTAESFAKDLEREGEEKGFKVDVVDLEEIENDIPGNILKKNLRDENGRNRGIFLMSTYGEGEPTDNAVSFTRFIRHDMEMIEGESKESAREEKKGDFYPRFSGLDYAVFGLGNKQYEHFNAMGKLVDKAMASLGANRLIPLGIGDDDDDLEGDFETWKDKHLWPALCLKYVGQSVADTPSKKMKLPECHYSIEYLDGPSKAEIIPMDQVHLSSKHYFSSVDCPVVLKRELRNPSDDGSTIHIEVDISNAGEEMNYKTADNLGILPINSEEDVTRLAKALKLDVNSYFRLRPAPGYEHKHAVIFPNPCSVHECLSRFCDIKGSPRRSELKLLAAYAKDETTRKALLRMASKEGKNEYNEKIVDAKVGLVDLIGKLCPNIEMPLEHFLSICPRLQPRYYTISSSSSVHPKCIHATVSVLQEKKINGDIFKGLCSNFLSDLSCQGNIKAFVRDSTFRLPVDSTKPIIMIGPGTGIAPMRALLQERSYQRKILKQDVGSNVLFFGCKKRDLDFLYEDELNAFEADGTLTKLHVAFSREQSEKVYVQHLLAQNGRDIWNFIDSQGAYIYVCGGVKMGQDVQEALRKIVSENGDLTTPDAKAYLDKLASTGRFVQELWA